MTSASTCAKSGVASTVATPAGKDLSATPDEEIEVWPKQINFVEPWADANDQVQKLRFSNRSSQSAVVIRIMVTTPELYSIKPRSVFIDKNEHAYVTVKLMALNRVKRLKDQGIQVETLQWKGTNLDEKELELAVTHIRDGRAPFPILQRVRIFFPTDISFSLPNSNKLVQSSQGSTSTE